MRLTHLQTIAGGSGAGPGWHGTSGVHTHITNTRIGDVELLERRYPVLVHRFGLREGTGGTGRWRGGDGCVRDFEVTEGMQVSILSEVRFVLGTGLEETADEWQRRTRQPYGMEGGAPGESGKNTWVKVLRKEDGDLPDDGDSEGDHQPPEPRLINLGGKATVWMGKVRRCR